MLVLFGNDGLFRWTMTGREVCDLKEDLVMSFLLEAQRLVRCTQFLGLSVGGVPEDRGS